jgi:Arc/MetJ family transcription regulator
MRTTIRLDDDLLTSAKRSAAESGRTLTAVIEDALREALSRRTTRGENSHVRLTTVGGNGPLPGVDLDDTAGLLELMDGSRGPA